MTIATGPSAAAAATSQRKIPPGRGAAIALPRDSLHVAWWRRRRSRRPRPAAVLTLSLSKVNEIEIGLKSPRKYRVKWVKYYSELQQ